MNPQSRQAARTVIAAMTILGSGFVLRSAGPQAPLIQAAGAVLRGQVVTSGGQPVRRAHVVASGPITVSTDTDPNGMFHFDSLTRGTYTIAPAKTGFVEMGPPAVHVVDGAGQHDIKVLMMPAGVITGRVLDRAGSALADVSVTLRKENAVVSRLTTDDRGVFRFHTLRAGTYDVWSATEIRDQAQTVTVSPGRTVDVQLISSWTANADAAAMSMSPGAPDDPRPVTAPAIRGRITSAETGSPLSSIPVRLIGSGLQRSVQTTQSGRYTFRDVPPGGYSIFAAATSRYIGLSYGQKTPQDSGAPVFIGSGRQIVDADFELPELKVLAGRLVDEFGDPAPDVTVVLVQTAVSLGRIRFVPLSGGTVTDDLGEFRFRQVPPGTFFLMVLSGPFATGSVLGGPAGLQGRGYGFALTFFPGTAQPAEAQPLKVDVRGDTAPVTFALVPAEMGHVIGRVLDRSGQPVSRANIMLLQLHAGDLRMAVPARATTNVDGWFSIRNVPVGSFVAQAWGNGFASETVMVSPRDTATLEVTLAPPTTVRGRLVLQGAPDPSFLEKVHIRATPTDFVRGPAGGVASRSVIDSDGTFEVPGLIGVNRLSFDVPLPWTLISVTSAGADVTDRPIDSREGDVDDLRVLFAPTASTVVCRVSDRDGRPLLTGVVLIFPQDETRLANTARYVRGLMADANGDYTTRGLPPGVYRAVPFERVPRRDWMALEFVETLRAQGESFTIGAGESVTVRIALRR